MVVRAWVFTTAAALVPLLAADPAPPCPFEAWGLGICDDFRKNQRSASGLAAIDGERTFPWPAACPRRALPSSPAELAAIVASGVPTIFTNASGAFGARVAAWRNVEGHFLPRHGDVRPRPLQALEVGENLGLQLRIAAVPHRGLKLRSPRRCCCCFCRAV